MNPQHRNISDPSQQDWNSEAEYVEPVNSDASWYPSIPNHARGPRQNMQQGQHSYDMHSNPRSVSYVPHEGSHRSRRSHRAVDEDRGLIESEIRYPSNRPMFSVPPENMTGGLSRNRNYEFTDSLHEFTVHPRDQNSGEYESRRRAPRHDRQYSQDGEDNYVYGGDPSRSRQPGGREAPIYKCPELDCGYGSLDKNAVRKHMSIHGTKRYSCSNCDREFHTARDLRRHQGDVHGGRSQLFICKVPDCNRHERNPFARRDNARQHVMGVHGVRGDMVEQMIEEIITPTGRTSYADTDSNSGVGSRDGYGDDEEDVLREFTYLHQYDTDGFPMDCQQSQYYSEDYSSRAPIFLQPRESQQDSQQYVQIRPAQGVESDSARTRRRRAHTVSTTEQDGHPRGQEADDTLQDAFGRLQLRY